MWQDLGGGERLRGASEVGTKAAASGWARPQLAGSTGIDSLAAASSSAMAGLLRLAGAARSLSRALAPAGGLPLRRLAASAAAVVEEEAYWTEWEEVEEARRWRAYASALTAESCPGGGGPRGVQWVVMGRPSPQKHAHTARLAVVLAVPYISMDTLVRQELNPASSLYKKIASSVIEGKLVPEDIIFGLLTKRLEEGYYRGESGFILDGIPRTHMQAVRSELKNDLKVLFISSEFQLVAAGSKKAVVIHVPFRLRKAFRKICARPFRCFAVGLICGSCPWICSVVALRRRLVVSTVADVAGSGSSWSSRVAMPWPLGV